MSNTTETCIFAFKIEVYGYPVWDELFCARSVDDAKKLIYEALKDNELNDEMKARELYQIGRYVYNVAESDIGFKNPIKLISDDAIVYVGTVKDILDFGHMKQLGYDVIHDPVIEEKGSDEND